MDSGKQGTVFGDVLQRMLERSVSRRRLIARSATVGVGLTTMGGLLAACGGDDDPTATPETAAPPAATDPTATPDAAQPPAAADPTATPAAAAPDVTPTQPPATGGDTPPRGGSITMATQNDWPSYDPHRQSASPGGIVMIYNALTALDVTGDAIEVAPELALSWELTEEYADFTLREGVRFHDGSEWNAEVLQFNVERLGDDQSFGRTFVATVESVEVISPYVARMHLSAPTGPLLSNFSTSADGRTYMISKQMAEQAGDDYGSSPETTAGTGPMRVIEWVSGSYDVIERTGEYWETGADGEPLPYFDRLRTQFTAEDSVRALSLRSGDIDYATNIASRDLAALESDANIEVVENEFQSTSYQFVFCTLPGRQFTDNLDLRKAIHYAIDREAMAEILGQGVGQPSYYFLPPGMLGYDDTLPHYYFDPDLARQHLEAAGFPNGVDVPLIVINRELDVQQAEMLQQMMANVNIRLNIEVMERLAWIARTEAGDFDFATYQTGVRPDPDSLIGARWESGSGRNQGQLSDPTMDGYLAEGRSSYDDEVRAEAYRNAQRYIYETAWYGTMWTRRYFAGHRTRVRDITPMYEGTPNFRNTWVQD
jgi:peptide/nickel transport system substrate-binding protein